MKAITANLSDAYEIVIPPAVREALRLEPGTTLLFLVEGDTVVIRPQPKSYTEMLRGLHKELWADPDAWLEGERASWA